MRELLSYYSNCHKDMNEEVIKGIRLKDNMVEKQPTVPGCYGDEAGRTDP